MQKFLQDFPFKYNWQKNPSEEFESKLEAIYSENLESFQYNILKENFAVKNLEKHETSTHEELFKGGDRSGEVYEVEDFIQTGGVLD